MSGEHQNPDGPGSQPSSEMTLALRSREPTSSRPARLDALPKELLDQITAEMPQPTLLRLASTSRALTRLLPELWIRDAKKENNAIFWAVRTRNLDGIRVAAGHGADVNRVRTQMIMEREHSYTPLSSAIMAGEAAYDVVACLLQHGASPRVQVTEGWLEKGSAFMVALRRARRMGSCPAPLVNLMLPYVDLDPGVPQDEITAEAMDLEVCMCYLFKGELKCSCSQGPQCSLSIVRSLINHCRDCGSDHSRLLSFAVASVTPRTAVQYLLGPGVTPTTQNIWDLMKTLTRLAERPTNPRDSRYDELAQTFYDLANHGLKAEPSDNFSIRRSLFTCVFSHRVDDGETKLGFVRYLISRGNNVNELRFLRLERNGPLRIWTPLLEALFTCFKRHYGRLNNAFRRPRMVLWVPIEFLALLEAGADPNVASPDGTTALASAVHCRLYGVARWLLDHGADVDMEGRSLFAGPRSCSPLLWAIYNTDEAMLELLLERRAEASQDEDDDDENDNDEDDNDDENDEDEDDEDEDDEDEDPSLTHPLVEALEMPASKFNPGLVRLLVKYGARLPEEPGHHPPLYWLLRPHVKPGLLKLFLRHGLSVGSAEADEVLDAFIRDTGRPYWKEKLRLLIAAGAGRDWLGSHHGDEGGDSDEVAGSSSSASSGGDGSDGDDDDFNDGDDDEHWPPSSVIYFSDEE